MMVVVVVMMKLRNGAKQIRAMKLNMTMMTEVGVNGDRNMPCKLNN